MRNVPKVGTAARLHVAESTNLGMKKLLQLYTDNLIVSGKSSEMLSRGENGAASVKRQFIGAEQHVHILSRGCNSRGAFSLRVLALLKISRH